MQTYISILRGINVGGHKTIKMEDLRHLYLDLGFEAATTYIQSGNVIFRATQISTQVLAKQISERIFDQFKMVVPVVVKTLEELQNIVTQNPFVRDETRDITHLHATFLAIQPNEVDIDAIKQGQYTTDEFYVGDKVIYLYCPDGYSNSKLTNSFLEKKLKTTATTRNWKTTKEILHIAERLL